MLEAPLRADPQLTRTRSHTKQGIRGKQKWYEFKKTAFKIPGRYLLSKPVRFLTLKSASDSAFSVVEETLFLSVSCWDRFTHKYKNSIFEQPLLPWYVVTLALSFSLLLSFLRSQQNDLYTCQIHKRIYCNVWLMFNIVMLNSLMFYYKCLKYSCSINICWLNEWWFFMSLQLSNICRYGEEFQGMEKPWMLSCSFA